MKTAEARGKRGVDRREKGVETMADPIARARARTEPIGPNRQTVTHQSTAGGASSRRITEVLLAGGVAGPPLFVLVFLVEGATRPGYSAWRNVVSQLGTGNGAWAQVANFLVWGSLALGFAVGLRRALRSGRGATWGPLLLGVYGAGLIVAGCFATDPAFGYPPGAPVGAAPESARTLHGTIHGFAGLIVFSALTAACFVLARRFAGDRDWRGWALYSIATGILVPAFLVASFGFAAGGTLDGLFQRFAIIIGWAWVALLALRLLRLARSATAG